MKYTFLFSGQGSQYVGMGKNMFNSFDYAKNIFKRASEILGFDLKHICFQDNLLINKTQYTQPAIFTYNMVLDYFLKDLGYTPTSVAGHSLGEYSALVSIDALSFDDALLLIKKRAKKMYDIGEKKPGKMAAIINANQDILKKLLKKHKNDVVVANFNSPNQQIISGNIKSIDIFTNEAKKIGIRRIIPLNVSGAFHSPLMKNARIYLEKFIKSTTFHDTKIPIYQNFCPKENFKADKIKNNLINQLDHPVKWNDIINTMHTMGNTNYMEVGPRNILHKLNKQILPEVNSKFVEDLEEFKRFV